MEDGNDGWFLFSHAWDHSWEDLKFESGWSTRGWNQLKACSRMCLAPAPLYGWASLQHGGFRGVGLLAYWWLLRASGVSWKPQYLYQPPRLGSHTIPSAVLYCLKQSQAHRTQGQGA